MVIQKLAIDQDQVLADLYIEWIKRYNHDYNDNLQQNQITEWNWHGFVKPECGEKIYRYLDDPDLFENLPVIKGSQEVTFKLSKRYEIFIVTAAFNPNNVPAKSRWLQKHFDFIDPKNYVFTRNKSIVNADWLIDDKPENLEYFEGYPILFDAPHNKNENRFHRVNNWEVISSWFDVI